MTGQCRASGIATLGREGDKGECARKEGAAEGGLHSVGATLVFPGDRCETKQEALKVRVKESEGFEGQGRDGGPDAGIAADLGPLVQLGSCSSSRLVTLDEGSAGLLDVRGAQWVFFFGQDLGVIYFTMYYTLSSNHGGSEV